MIDLRTDFVSRPTPAMVDAMVRAASLPPGFGLRDDPMVEALERRAAAFLGKEDALFCPTCSAANQIAINLACRPADRVVAEATSHIVTSEGGAPAALSGVMIRGVAGVRGAMALDELDAALDEGDAVQGRARLVVIENTHVRSGGSVLPLAHMQEVRERARARNISVHLDGSRLCNAATALGVDVRTLAHEADTVALSLNKGLAAPMGAILAGTREAIADAVGVRHRFGCSWRTAGIPAAAALVALDTMADRLGEDHRRARQLAEGLARLPGLRVDLDQVQSNIVLADLDPELGGADVFAKDLATCDVAVLSFGKDRVRLVVWYGIGAMEIESAIAAFAQRLGGAPPPKSAVAERTGR